MQIIIYENFVVVVACDLWFDAHQDPEVCLCWVFKESGDISSDSHQIVATSASLLSAKRLPSGMNCGRWKWTYEELFRTCHSSYVTVLLYIQIIIYENFVVVIANS